MRRTGRGAGAPAPALVRRAGATAAIVIGLFGCLTTEPCACPPIVPHVTLFGTATSAGVPIAGADIVARIFFDSTCPVTTDASPALDRFAHTDTAGRYEGHLPVIQPASTCMHVGAVSPPGASDTLWSEPFLLDVARVDGPSRFRYDLSLP